MEGFNPSEGCTDGCVSCRRGWVAFPWSSGIRPRRDPLIDAVNRTSNPCERPARYPPCCDPVPKFGLLREKPVCNINCFEEERAEAKWNEHREKMQKYVDCNYCYQPEVVIQNLDPCRPLIIQSPPEIPPEQKFHLRDQKCKTDIIAGFFNADDNKTFQQREREACDPDWVQCGPNPVLKPYPCRGVIDTPCQRWVSEAEEKRMCFGVGCENTIYHQPEYQEKQRQMKLQRAMEQQYQQRMQMMENALRAKRFATAGQCYTGECASGRCSETSYCRCR